MEQAAYNFKIEGNSYSENEVCVMASDYAEAKKLAEQLLKGSKVKLGELRRVIDCRLTVNQQNIVERKLIIDEHSIKHSGEITEVKINGGKRKTK